MTLKLRKISIFIFTIVAIGFIVLAVTTVVFSGCSFFDNSFGVAVDVVCDANDVDEIISQYGTLSIEKTNYRTNEVEKVILDDTGAFLEDAEGNPCYCTTTSKYTYSNGEVAAVLSMENGSFVDFNEIENYLGITRDDVKNSEVRVVYVSKNIVGYSATIEMSGEKAMEILGSTYSLGFKVRRTYTLENDYRVTEIDTKYVTEQGDEFDFSKVVIKYSETIPEDGIDLKLKANTADGERLVATVITNPGEKNQNFNSIVFSPGDKLIVDSEGYTVYLDEGCTVVADLENLNTEANITLYAK